MTQIHTYNEIAFVTIVELQQYWMPITLMIGILIFLVWLQFKMTSATQIPPPNPFRAIEQLATAVGELLSGSEMVNSSSSDITTFPANQPPSSALSPEYLQKKSEIGAVFQEAFDLKQHTIKSFPAFVQALDSTDDFITEFWEEFPPEIQENLKAGAIVVLDLFPAIEGEADYVKLLMPLLNEVIKRPLRILKSLLTLRQTTAYRQQENLLKDLAQKLQDLALSIEALAYADELSRTHPTATVAQLRVYLEESEGWKGDDLEQCLEIVLQDASDIEF